MNLYEAMEQGRPINWEHYVGCNGCESILFQKTFVCPCCNSYNPIKDPEEVRRMAEAALERHQKGEQRVPEYDD